MNKNIVQFQTASGEQSPWMTRKQAKEYLCLSMRQVDYLCLPLAANPRPVHGRIRVRPMRLPGSKRTLPRLLRADVHRLLPLPDGSIAGEPLQVNGGAK